MEYISSESALGLYVEQNATIVILLIIRSDLILEQQIFRLDSDNETPLLVNGRSDRSLHVLVPKIEIGFV